MQLPLVRQAAQHAISDRQRGVLRLPMPELCYHLDCAVCQSVTIVRAVVTLVLMTITHRSMCYLLAATAEAQVTVITTGKVSRQLGHYLAPMVAQNARLPAHQAASRACVT